MKHNPSYLSKWPALRQHEAHSCCPQFSSKGPAIIEKSLCLLLFERYISRWRILIDYFIIVENFGHVVV